MFKKYEADNKENTGDSGLTRGALLGFNSVNSRIMAARLQGMPALAQQTLP